MKKNLFLISLLLLTFCTLAQTDDYELYKAKAVKDMTEGKFADAQKRFRLMMPYVTKTNKEDYDKILEVLQDSIDNVYNRAIKLKNDKKYTLAISEFQKLIDRYNQPLKSPLYAYIGYCYEGSGLGSLSELNYEMGLKYNEPLSALYLAKYIKKYDNTTTSETIIELYKKAKEYPEAMDSLGVEYARIGNVNQSYKCYKQSNTPFAKYNMASYILNSDSYPKLWTKFWHDDPIELLTEAADAGYAPAQYYLGMLYYYAREGERVEKNMTKGLKFIEKAASQGYDRAKEMLYKIKYK